MVDKSVQAPWWGKDAEHESQQKATMTELRAWVNDEVSKAILGKSLRTHLFVLLERNSASFVDDPAIRNVWKRGDRLFSQADLHICLRAGPQFLHRMSTGHFRMPGTS
jgi:hypothetical protein